MDPGRCAAVRAARYGFELVSEALFFLATALSGLATRGGSASFSEASKQQLISRAFAVCKRLMLEFKERRDEARDLLTTLLSWVFSTYMSELLSLSLEAGFEEFAESGMHQRALRQMVRQRGGKTTAHTWNSSHLEPLTLGTAHTWNGSHLEQLTLGTRSATRPAISLC